MLLRAILRLLLGLLFGVRVTGHVSQLSRGRPLVVANHDSLLDALLVALFLPDNPLIVLPRTLDCRHRPWPEGMPARWPGGQRPWRRRRPGQLRRPS